MASTTTTGGTTFTFNQNHVRQILENEARKLLDAVDDPKFDDGYNHHEFIALNMMRDALLDKIRDFYLNPSKYST